MYTIPFSNLDWSLILKVEYVGDSGYAYWQTIDLDGLRLRIVEYTPGYIADHWCQKGHVVHCLEGEFNSEMSDGNVFNLKAGMTYVVSDDLSSHRSMTTSGAKLLIIDGDFLKLPN